MEPYGGVMGRGVFTLEAAVAAHELQQEPGARGGNAIHVNFSALIFM